MSEDPSAEREPTPVEPEPSFARITPVSPDAPAAPAEPIAPPALRPPMPSAPPAPPARMGSLAGDVVDLLFGWARDRVLGQDPTFLAVLGPFAAITAILFSRLPTTNYIFDEQEALLANPYVNASGGLRFVDAIHRDFWGLPPDRSIGSYRPIPDFLWRAVWQLSSKPEGLFRQPFVHHIYNVFFHAINAALVTMIVWAWTKRRGQAWLAGLLFATCAVLTEAISGIVGIADVLGGMGALLALLALSLPGWAMPFAVFMAVAFGLFSKESALVCVPLVPFAALLVAPLTHPGRPARFHPAPHALAGAAAAFYLYVELRKRWFPSPLPKELAEGPPWDAPLAKRLGHDFLVWFHQAPLPKDPLNNPLVDADRPHRVAGALRVYARGLRQIVFPLPLSGDYSFPQEPVPDQLVFSGSVAGAALTALPPLWSLVLWIVALIRERLTRLRAREGDPSSPISLPPPPLEGGGSLGQRLAGLALILLALSLFALDLAVLRPRGFALAWRSLPLWVAGVPAVVLGLGLLVEGWPTLTGLDARRPLAFSGPAPGRARGHLGRGQLLPPLQHPRRPPDGARRALLVLPRHRNRDGARRPLLLHPRPRQTTQAPVHRARPRRPLPPLPGRAGLPAREGPAPERRRLLGGDQETPSRGAPRRTSASPVMKGARKDLQTRLDESQIALSLAPKWAMAHVYTGDTLCRMHRPADAWPYYRDGFNLGPNDQSLIALALQCPLRRERGSPPRGRAAHHRHGARGIVDRVPRHRHAAQPREEQGRRPQVPTARLQRGAEGLSRIRGTPPRPPLTRPSHPSASLRKTR